MSERPGDEITAGAHTLSFTADFSRHNRIDKERKILPKEIVLTSADGEKRYPFTDTLTAELKNNSWYSVELWGSIDAQENMLLALAAPIYTK